MGSLLNSFEITKLDLENQNPIGFINKLDTITKYSSRFVTGTPTTTASPGPTKSFFQTYGPLNQYLELKLDNLKSTTANSNLDIEDRTPNGGIPYKQDKDPTKYPSIVTGTPTTSTNPGAPNKFNQTYTPSNTYLLINPIKGTGKLKSTTANTDLDVESPTPGGGIPYKVDKDPTVYSKYNTGTPTPQSNPGAPVKFNQTLTPTNDYISTIGDGKLEASTNSTNLDVEDSKPNGGIPYKIDKDPTAYPSIVTGTPTTSANPGAPSKFNQVYTPTSTYLSKNPIKSTGKLKSTVANTNLDVENPTPGGGIPYKQDKDPTVYSEYNTGTPTTSTNPGAPNKFDHIYNPKNRYLDKNPIKSEGNLKSTTANTNLDVENPTPNGGIPYKQTNDPTTYPVLAKASTSINGYFATPGKPAAKFNQVWTPENTYLGSLQQARGGAVLPTIGTRDSGTGNSNPRVPRG